MRNLIDLINESNHCGVKFEDIDGDICPSCEMHKEWHRGLDAETMDRSRKFAADEKARGEMFDARRMARNEMHEDYAPPRQYLHLRIYRQMQKIADAKPTTDDAATTLLQDLNYLMDAIKEFGARQGGEMEESMHLVLNHLKMFLPRDGDVEAVLADPQGTMQEIIAGLKFLHAQLGKEGVMVESAETEEKTGSFEAVFWVRKKGRGGEYEQKWLTVPTDDRSAAWEAFRKLGYDVKGGTIMPQAEASEAAEREWPRA